MASLDVKVKKKELIYIREREKRERDYKKCHTLNNKIIHLCGSQKYNLVTSFRMVCGSCFDTTRWNLLHSFTTFTSSK